MSVVFKTCDSCPLKSDCFSNLRPTELELIMARKTELHYRKNENIAKQGAYLHHVLFIQGGLVKIYMEKGNDEDMILNLISGGHFIGLPNLFMDVPLQFSVASITDSIICAIDINIIHELVSVNGDFAKSIIRELNVCNRFYFERIFTSSKKNLNGKMADAILHLADKVYQNEAFIMQLTRKDLADFAGMSLMSAVKVVKDFESNKIIEEKGNEFRILDKDKLKHLSKTG